MNRPSPARQEWTDAAIDARVDVLAVMDPAMLVCACCDGPECARLIEARAAVAELIEAAANLRRTKPTYSIEYGRGEERLDAALARITGETK